MLKYVKKGKMWKNVENTGNYIFFNTFPNLN